MTKKNVAMLLPDGKVRLLTKAEKEKFKEIYKPLWQHKFKLVTK